MAETMAPPSVSRARPHRNSYECTAFTPYTSCRSSTAALPDPLRLSPGLRRSPLTSPVMATDTPRPSGGSTPPDAKAEAKAKASDLKNKAQEEAQSRLAEGKSQAADALDDISGALHETGSALRDRDRDAFARYADAAADQVEQFTRSIRDRNVGEILDEAHRFARRDPGLFIGGAFVLGIFGARFLKASAPGADYRSDSGWNSGSGYRSGSSRHHDPDEAPYRIRHTAGGEMPDPGTGRTQVPASASPSSAL